MNYCMDFIDVPNLDNYSLSGQEIVKYAKRLEICLKTIIREVQMEDCNNYQNFNDVLEQINSLNDRIIALEEKQYFKTYLIISNKD